MTFGPDTMTVTLMLKTKALPLNMAVSVDGMAGDELPCSMGSTNAEKQVGVKITRLVIALTGWHEIGFFMQTYFS
jgi:hypothetical protein